MLCCLSQDAVWAVRRCHDRCVRGWSVCCTQTNVILPNAAIAAAAIANAVITRSQFYPATIYLTTNKVNVVVIHTASLFCPRLTLVWFVVTADNGKPGFHGAACVPTDRKTVMKDSAFYAQSTNINKLGSYC